MACAWASLNVRTGRYLNVGSGKFLDQLDEAMLDLEPALQLTIDHAPEFQDKSPRHLFGMFVAEAVMHVAALERSRPEQVKVLRDILVHFSMVPTSSPLSVVQQLLTENSVSALTSTPNLVGVMEQLDEQLGTKYTEAANSLYLLIATFVLHADGPLTKKQQKLLDRLAQESIQDPVSKPNNERTKDVVHTKSDELPEADESRTVEELLLELDSLIGLGKVKQDVRDLVNFLKVQKLRQEKGLAAAQLSRHLVFYGNPGTGKTTIARLLAKIYRALGIVTKGHFIEADRAALVAGYVGQTALKVKALVSEALGGVLFIDEAYTLCNDERDSFGQEAIDCLLKLMEDNRDNLIVIVAGYTDKMSKFVASNPGLRSRFNKYFYFEDYLPNELAEIFDSFCLGSGFRLQEDARDRLSTILAALYSGRNDQFGNARDVRNLFEQAIGNQANRIVLMQQIDESALEELTAEDLPSMLMADNV